MIARVERGYRESRVARRRSIGALLATLAGSGALAACGGGAPGQSSTLPQGDEPVALDPASFTTQIDNPYWPMKPGSRWVYEERSGGGEPSVRTVVTVTKRTKRVANGVVGRIVRDVSTQRGKLVEVTDDWYAQDADGNVWYLGERTTAYSRSGRRSREGSWEAGVNGAQPGIAVPANPAPALTYRQEHYAGHAEDRGRVLDTNLQAEVPAGHYTRVLLTEDTTALDPKEAELKFYAPRVGPVRSLTVSGGTDREELRRYTPGD